MTNQLLPPNSTLQELAAEQAMARIANVPVLVREVWNPDTCPSQALPWLAWAFSVDNWDDSWSDAQKRQAIKDSFLVHRRKGTAGSMKKALAALGFETQVYEWFQEDGEPYTFRVDANVFDESVSDEMLTRVQGIVAETKNLRSHVSDVVVAGASAGIMSMGCGCSIGDVVEIYPE